MINAVLRAKYLIHQRPNPVHIFIANLHKDGAGIGEEIAGDGESIPQVGEVAVDAISPGVAEGFDLLRFAG